MDELIILPRIGKLTMWRQTNFTLSAIFLGMFVATILWLIWNLVPWLSGFPVGYDSPCHFGIPLGFCMGVTMNVFLNLRFQWACAGIRVGAIVLVVCIVCAIVTFTKMQGSTDWERAGWQGRYYVSKVGVISGFALFLAGTFSHLAFRSQSTKSPERAE